MVRAEATRKEVSKPPLESKNMRRNTIPEELYIDASHVFHCADKRQYEIWFTGQDAKRHRRSETVLHRLVKKGKLRSMQYGKKLIYMTPRRAKADEFYGMAKAVHGLACTECLVRIYRSKMDGVVVAEKYFFGCGSVPEWGIIYPGGTMLLFEFCTKSNFFYTGNMKGKLEAYKRNLEKIENKFQAKALVLFVIDIPREIVQRFVSKIGNVGSGNGMPAPSPTANTSALYDGGFSPSDPHFFTDYKTFLQVPLGQQLTAPIYFWMDGKEYPLTKNV